MAKKIDRREKPIDIAVLKGLAEIHCTYQEMAHILNIHIDTLRLKYTDIIERGKSDGRKSLRRMMFDKAKEGNVPIMIWLSKQHLEMRDNLDLSAVNGAPVIQLKYSLDEEPKTDGAIDTDFKHIDSDTIGVQPTSGTDESDQGHTEKL